MDMDLSRSFLLVPLAAAIFVAAAACGDDEPAADDDTSTTDAGGGGRRDSSSTTPEDDGGPAEEPSQSDPGLVGCITVKCTVETGQLCCLTFPSGSEPGSAVCRTNQGSPCRGHALECDEAADCEDGEVCCAEGDNGLIKATCQKSCAAPNVVACKTDAECTGGKCATESCDGGPPEMKFCGKPPGCQ